MENQIKPYEIKKEDLIPFMGAIRYMRRMESQYQNSPPIEAHIRLISLGVYNFIFGWAGAGAILGLEKLLN